MNRKISVALAMMVLSTSIVLAKDEKAKTAAAAAQIPTAITSQQDKDLLISNINNMRNQELRVAVLKQMLNEEIAKLSNIQAVFCDQYKLDVDKFREGLYRYDEKAGKFVETGPAKPQK